jgi:CBS domain-containing protein
MSEKERTFPLKADISDEDIIEAMKDISGYLDITPGDFKEVYQTAYRHAMSRIASSVKARNIMTTKVFSVKRDTPVAAIAELMAKNIISGVPVIEESGKVAGIISERDFLSGMGVEGAKTMMGIIADCLKNKGCMAISIRALKAGDIMTSPAITVLENTTVSEIAGIFNEKNINRVPVTDSEGNLIGIVSRADLLRYLPFREKQ